MRVPRGVSAVTGGQIVAPTCHDVIEHSRGFSTDSKQPSTILKAPSGQIVLNGKQLNFSDAHIVIPMLIASKGVRGYMLNLCKAHHYDYHTAIDPDELIRSLKRSGSPIAFVDYEAVTTYGVRIYSKIKVTCPGCNIILLSDRNHRGHIKEAMEMGIYACILAPFQEWEVLSIIGNVFVKEKSLGKGKRHHDQEV